MPAERFYLKTFGCQMNEYETVRMAKVLESLGHAQAPSYAGATVIILNTCTVRQKAEDKIYSELGRIKGHKTNTPELLIGIGGCLAQQEGERLLKKFPYVDFVFGTRALPCLPDILSRARAGARIVRTEMDISCRDFYGAHPYRPDTGQVSAFVTVMQGCDNFCSYCIVPHVRGREWSRTPEEIVEEAVRLSEAGVRDVMLLGQNVNSYGKNLVPAVTFTDLVRRVASAAGLARIRFTTSHPKDLSPGLIDAFATVPKLCPHIHLPLQSGCDRILAHMNRKYGRKEYLDKIDRLRAACPAIAITSDIIVGYPGETDGEFMETADIIEKIQFDDLFIFHYTDRLGTKASEMPDSVPYPVKIKRLERLNEIQAAISLSKNRACIGSVQEVLFEQHSKRGAGFIAGRTGTAKVVNCAGPDSMIGHLAPVVIERATVHSLTGKLMNQEERQ